MTEVEHRNTMLKKLWQRERRRVKRRTILEEKMKSPEEKKDPVRGRMECD